MAWHRTLAISVKVSNDDHLTQGQGHPKKKTYNNESKLKELVSESMNNKRVLN